MVMLCPKCGRKVQISSNSYSQCPTCNVQLVCSNSIDSIEPLRECPYCGNLQYGGEFCSKCKKNMKQPFKLYPASFIVFFITLTSLFSFFILCYTKDSSAILAIFPIVLFGYISICILKGAFSAKGQYIEGKAIEKKARNKMLSYLFLKVYGLNGFSDRDSCYLYVDEKNKRLIFVSQNEKIERFLKFQQILDVRLNYKTTTVKKSSIGRAIVGGMVAGPTGAIVGSISGLGEKQKGRLFFEIEYVSSDKNVPTQICFPYDGIAPDTLSKFCQKLRIILNLDKAELMKTTKTDHPYL